jgi:hypothetical protein
VSVNSGLSVLVGWNHDLMNPFVEGLVDLMPWPRRLLSASAPSQVYLDDASVFELKQCIVCADRMCNGCQLYAMQWMPWRKFNLDFPLECGGLSRNKLFPGL